MQEKLLTISIAAYNSAPTLRETLGSLTADEANLDRLEIIVVNDGSRDDTLRIAREIGDRYPDTVVVIDKPNGGYGSTINASLAVARGKYYKLLDGDDWFQTDALRGFIEFLDRCEADLVMMPYVEVRRGERRIDNHPELPPGAVPLRSARVDDPLFVMHEMAIRTEALRRSGRSIAEGRYYTDAEFAFYCVAASETVARYGAPVYRYRLGVAGQSVSLEGIRRHQGDYAVVARRIMSAYAGAAADASGAKRAILDQCVRGITYHTYRSFMLAARPRGNRRALAALDRELRRDYPEAYRTGGGSRLVRLSRALRFHPYGLLCRIAMKKLERELARD